MTTLECACAHTREEIKEAIIDELFKISCEKKDVVAYEMDRYKLLAICEARCVYYVIEDMKLTTYLGG